MGSAWKTRLVIVSLENKITPPYHEDVESSQTGMSQTCSNLTNDRHVIGHCQCMCNGSGLRTLKVTKLNVTL